MSYICVHINLAGQMSVDVFSEKHAGFFRWRTYWNPTPASIRRLRAFYLKYKKRVYITKAWSVARWRAYKAWCLSGAAITGGGAFALSLDSLPTKEHVCPK